MCYLGACFSAALPGYEYQVSPEVFFQARDQISKQHKNQAGVKLPRRGVAGRVRPREGDALAALGDSYPVLPPRSSPWQPSLAPPATVAFPPHGSLFMIGRMSNCVPRSAARRSSRAAGPPATSLCIRHRSKVRWASSTDPPSQMCPGQSVSSSTDPVCDPGQPRPPVQASVSPCGK